MVLTHQMLKRKCFVQYRKLESRPIFVMAKKRLRRVMQEWQAAIKAKQTKKERLTAVDKHAHHKLLKAVLVSW